MGTKFLFRLILEEDDSDGCPTGSVTRLCHWIVHLKMIQMADFMSHIFYCNLEKRTS